MSSLSSSPSPEGNDFSRKAEQKWSTAANSYVRYFEPMTVVAGRFLLGLLKLRFQQRHQQGLKVLEAGCGAGGLAKELMLDASSPSSSLSISELVLTDLSEGMLDRARDILNDVAADVNSNGNGNGNSDIPQIRIEQADFTALDRQKFPNGYFDRYYTNLCLHYAENPDDVISEASRVLKACDGKGEHGGIAGFTVWGRRADSPVMTIVPDILEGFRKKEERSQQQQKRSPFHMGEDDEALRQRFLRDGMFSRCTVMHYPAVLESLNAKDYVEAILDGAPSTKKELEEDYSEEDQQIIRNMVHEKALELLNQGKPLILDMAMIVAQK